MDTQAQVDTQVKAVIADNLVLQPADIQEKVAILELVDSAVTQVQLDSVATVDTQVPVDLAVIVDILE